MSPGATDKDVFLQLLLLLYLLIYFNNKIKLNYKRALKLKFERATVQLRTVHS